MQIRKTMSILVAAAALQACGGGGGGDNDDGPVVDTTPDTPSVAGEAVQVGESVERRFTVSGINQPIAISIEGGEYAVGSGEFGLAAGTVQNGDAVTVRIQSSDTFEGLATATVTLGTVSFDIEVATEAEDLLPEAITFAPLAMQLQNVTVDSNEIVVDGINNTVMISIENGEYSIDSGAFSSDPSTLDNGQTVQLRLSTSGDFSTETIASVTIGEGQYAFSATTLAEDPVPDTLSFEMQEEVEPETSYSSEVLTIAGINTAAPLEVSGGEYSIDGGEFVSEASTIMLGQTIQLRLLSSSDTETQADVTVTIGGLAASFSVTTRSENIPPEMTFVYPWENSMIDSGSTVVRGLATDLSGIESVMVSGELASLGEPEVIDGLTQVAWSAQVQLSYGENIIDVDVEDTKGNLSEDNMLAIRRETPYPLTFSVDAINNRVLGFGNTSLVSASLDDGAITHIADISNSVQSGLSCLRADTGDVYYALSSFIDPNIHNLRRYNINSNIEVALGSVAIEPSDIDVGSNDFASLSDLVCDSDTDSLYILRSVLRNAVSIYSEIAEITLDEIPTELVFAKTGDVGLESWTAKEMTLIDGRLVTNNKGDNGDILSIHLEDKSVETLFTNFTEFLSTFAVDFSRRQWFYTDTTNVFSVSMDTQTIENISSIERDGQLPFPQDRTMELLKAENKLLVSDAGLNALVEVDVTTGERREVVAERVGSGPHMIAIRDSYLSRDGSTLYVLDDGGNAGQKILAIDLATGNRTKIGSISSPSNIRVGGIAADEDTGTLYASVGDEIIALDLETEVSTVIASQSVGTGAVYSNVTDLIFDAAEGRLLFTDSGRDALYDVNLDTGVRSIVSQEGVTGDGAALANPVSVVFSADKQSVYVANQQDDSILSIDLATGNRSVFINTCIGTSGEDNWSLGQNLQEMHLDAESNILYIVNNRALTYDLNTNACSIVSNRGPSGFSVIDSGELLFLAFREVVVVDRESSQTAIISR